MRPRFSLRTLFIITTLTAVACAWMTLPSWTAQRFINAVAANEFEKADNFFRNPDDRFLVHWADIRWGFKCEAKLAPWSWADALRGQRKVTIEARYFALDQNAAQVLASNAGPLSLGPVTSMPIRYDSTYIDKTSGFAMPMNQFEQAPRSTVTPRP